MHPRIKNCGLKTTEAVDQAVATGASFVGFVHYSSSPRHVDLPLLERLVAHAKPRIKTVAVLVAPTEEELLAITRTAEPDYVQLHKIPSIDYIARMQACAGIPIISAISVRHASDLTYAAAMEEVSRHLLFDAPQAGSGTTFDWRLLKALSLKKPWFLAGGLTDKNVAEALRITGAPMVDVSSGIESSPGEKSLEKIAAFNAAVLHAKA